MTYSPKTYYMGGGYLNDAQEIFEKIIYKNTNVKMVVCGHSLSPIFIEYLEIPKLEGDKVHCIMVNYQMYSEGGSGNVGLLFSQESKFVLYSYSAGTGTKMNYKVSFDLE